MIASWTRSFARCARRSGRAPRPGVTGMILAIVSAAGFSTLPVLYKYSFSLGATTTGVLAWRFCIASALMLIYCCARRLSLRTDRATAVRVALIGSVGYGGFSWLYSTSVRFIPAWVATMLFSVYPVATALIAGPALGERLDRAKVRAMIISLLGCAFIVWAPALGGGIQRLDIRGVVMALAAGVSYAAYSVVSRRIVAGLQPVVMSTYVMLWGAGFYIVGAIVSGDRWVPSAAGSWAAVASLAVISTAIPMAALMGALIRIGATRTAILGTSEPLMSAILAFVFLRERFEWIQAVGAALILGSVLVVRKGLGTPDSA